MRVPFFFFVIVVSSINVFAAVMPICVMHTAGIRHVCGQQASSSTLSVNHRQQSHRTRARSLGHVTNQQKKSHSFMNWHDIATPINKMFILSANKTVKSCEHTHTRVLYIDTRQHGEHEIAIMSGPIYIFDIQLRACWTSLRRHTERYHHFGHLKYFIIWISRAFGGGKGIDSGHTVFMFYFGCCSPITINCTTHALAQCTHRTHTKCIFAVRERGVRPRLL